MDAISYGVIMMSAHFALTLDTTPPSIEILAHTWVTITTDLDFEVKSNEETDPGWQDGKIVDASGTEHKIIMVYRDGAWWGLFDTWSIAPGMATLNVKLKDTVHNTGEGTIFIQVLNQAILKATSKIATRNIVLVAGERTFDGSKSQRELVVSSKPRNIDINLGRRETKTGVE